VEGSEGGGKKKAGMPMMDYVIGGMDSELQAEASSIRFTRRSRRGLSPWHNQCVPR